MNSMIMLKVAGPMVVLSLLLLTIGVLAAVNVQNQQRTHSDLIAQEVHGMMAGEDVFLVFRDVRRELDLFLRSHDRQHLSHVAKYLEDVRDPLATAVRLARTEKEKELIEIVEKGYRQFKENFEGLSRQATTEENDREFAKLNDEFLTQKVLEPVRDCIRYNRQVVDRTEGLGASTAKQMRLGFLLLGITGSIAGLLFGLGIARALSRSIVQLDVSVRSVAGKLNEVGQPVHISHLGDLQGLEFSVRRLEDEIGGVVEKLHQHELELLRSEQLAIVGQLAAGMAHELRNPLMPVKVLVQAAMEKGNEVGLAGEELRIVNDEISRLEESIQSFLDFARPPALEATPVDIGQVIRRSLDLVWPKALQQNVKLQLVLPMESLVSRADATQLRQVLLNLMLNSLDAVPEGGWIEIELSKSLGFSEDEPRLQDGEITEHDAMRLGDSMQQWLTIRVSDSGTGFPPELLDRAFDPFVSTKETGTGLGLSICKRIVSAHGGKIRVSNRHEGGAEFLIHLPYVA